MRYLRSGLIQHDQSQATEGFTLFSPIAQTKTCLIDMDGDVVHEWDLPSPPGNYTYLMANGNLLAACRSEGGPEGMAARGGRIVELDWDGNVVWEYIDHYQHHDFRRLPNGNLIYIGWERLPDETASRVQGGLPGSDHGGEIWGDFIREGDPAGNTVWEWHCATDMEIEKYPICPICHRNEFAHANSVTLNRDGDVMVSWRHNHLVAVIDRATKKFKWEMCDMALFGHQHDFQEIGNGNYMLFANRDHTDKHGVQVGSAILEIDPASKEIVWEYTGLPLHTFFSPHISGCQRLASGNTLICEGIWGHIFEVTPGGEIVWEYVSPFFIPKGHPSGREGINQMFRAYRYAPDSPEIGGRLSL